MESEQEWRRRTAAEARAEAQRQRRRSRAARRDTERLLAKAQAVGDRVTALRARLRAE